MSKSRFDIIIIKLHTFSMLANIAHIVGTISLLHKRAFYYNDCLPARSKFISQNKQKSADIDRLSALLYKY